MKIYHRLIGLLLFTFFIINIIFSLPVHAAGNVNALEKKTYQALPLSGKITNNLSLNDYSSRMFYSGKPNCIPSDKYSAPVTSYLFENKDHTLTRLECLDTSILVETYSPNGKTLKSKKSIPFESEIFGGFFAGKDYNFLVFGSENPNENDSKEIMRVVKYTKDWQKLGHGTISGANTTIPFWCGSLRMTEANDTLYIHTCHRMYASSDGKNHQANMTYAFRESSMECLSANYKILWRSGYCSHSFNQFIETDGTYLFRVDHGDAYPRGITLVRSLLGNAVTNIDYTAMPIDLTKTGKIGDNWTGASIGGFELSGNNCLIAGNVVNYQTYDVNPDNTRNIFISVTDKNLSASSVNMLTKYSSKSGVTTSTPHLIKISNTKFLVMWEEILNGGKTFRTRMATVNASGLLSSSIYTSDCRLSDCKPLLCHDGMVRWYVANGKSVTLYTVNPDCSAEPLSVHTLPTVTAYYLGDTFSSKGLKIQYKDSKGATKTLSSGFTVTKPEMKNAGIETVKVTYNGYSTYFPITITKPSVDFDIQSLTFKKIGSRYAATASPSNCGGSVWEWDFGAYRSYTLRWLTVIPEKAPVTWSTSDKKVVEVNSNGMITPISDGKATIKATISYKNKKYSSSLSVTVTGYGKYKAPPKAYSIKYQLNGGKNNSKNPKSYTNNTATFILKNPTRKGYSFKGWYSDKKLTKKVTQIKKGSTGNKTLYAKWSKKTYQITYELNGGKNNKKNAKKYTVTTSTIKLKNPTKKGYTFKGWYADANFTRKVSGIKKGAAGNKTLYAKWTKNTYKITYKLNGGTNGKNPKTYTVTDTVTLKNPTRKGYTFKGWYSDAKCTKKVTKIVKGSTGNKTLYAKWEKK